MKTKQIILLALLLMIIRSLNAQAQTLVLWHSDGTSTEVELYTQPNIQFNQDKVLVTSPVANLEYDAKDVIRFTYKGVNTGVSSPTEEADYIQEKEQIVFRNIKSTDKIALYKTNGIRVPVRLTRHGDSAVLPLSSIPTGIYMLSVNGRTSKFSKK
ncbi:MAG: hypothetical protein J6W75_10155 [Bacteroidaceae bacterium]|nr:hypothetical protein [Bacteroidaceae bacterium]